MIIISLGSEIGRKLRLSTQVCNAKGNQNIKLTLDPYSQAGIIIFPKDVLTLILRTCGYERPCSRGS